MPHGNEYSMSMSRAPGKELCKVAGWPGGRVARGKFVR